MADPRQTHRRRRLEAWLWGGPVGHLLGGALDLLGAFARYAVARRRHRGRGEVA